MYNTGLRIDQIDLKSLAKNTGKVILVLAELGAIVSIAAVAPNLPVALAGLGEIFQKAPRPRIRKALRRLTKQRLVEIKDIDGIATITLTERGRQRISRFNLEHMKLHRPAQWDRKWRIIIFDVPEKYHRARSALRSKIKELEFFPLQKSVFIYPFACRDEVDFIADFFSIGRYLNYIEATHIDDESFLKQHFQLT